MVVDNISWAELFMWNWIIYKLFEKLQVMLNAGYWCFTEYIIILFTHKTYKIIILTYVQFWIEKKIIILIHHKRFNETLIWQFDAYLRHSSSQTWMYLVDINLKPMVKRNTMWL